jgi:hypothetical protein
MADVVEVIEQDGGTRMAKDLFSGACGGIAQVLIGMPNVVHTFSPSTLMFD